MKFDLSRIIKKVDGLQDLSAPFRKEIDQVIKEMPADRAPGPDGFIGLFFQKSWSIVKVDVMAALHHLFLGNGHGFGRLNQALITLIPKKRGACQVGDFRPISLVHSLPKIGSKLKVILPPSKIYFALSLMHNFDR